LGDLLPFLAILFSLVDYFELAPRRGKAPQRGQAPSSLATPTLSSLALVKRSRQTQSGSSSQLLSSGTDQNPQPITGSIAQEQASISVIQQQTSSTLSSLTTMTTSAPVMPMPHAGKAPKFTGDPTTISTFLSSYEALASAAGLSDEDKVSRVVIYADQASRELWMQLSGFRDNVKNWTKFKDEILKQYPDADKAQNYRKPDLDAIVDEWNRGGIFNLSQLQSYTIRFNTIALSLEYQALISTHEIIETYKRGLKDKLRTDLELQLKIKFPDPSNRPTLANVQAEARFVLQHYSATSPGVTKVEDNAAPVKPEATDQLMNAINNLSLLVQQISSTRPPPSRPLFQPYQDNRPRALMCIFDSQTDHLIRDCPALKRYLQEGKCIRDVNTGRICLPNGMMIARTGNKDLKGSLDDWLLQNPNWTKSPNALHFIGAVGGTYVGEPATQPVSAPEIYMADNVNDVQEVDTVPEIGKVYELLQRQTRGQQKQVAVEIPSRPKAPPPPNPSNKNPQQEARNKSQAAVPIIPKPNPTQPFRQDQQRPNPAYRNIAPAENPKLITDVLNTIKETQVPISVDALLALSPALRQQLREFVSVKRVPVNFQEGPVETAFLTQSLQRDETSTLRDSNGLAVADDSVCLRALKVNIEDSRIEAVLDDGATVCVMSKSCWQKLDQPVNPERKMSLEVANGFQYQTYGVVANMPVVIGGIELRLQVQVMDGAPFDFLLGRPFSKLASTVVVNKSNGDQTVLKDPNSDKVIGLPSRERTVKKDQLSFYDQFRAAAEGF